MCHGQPYSFSDILLLVPLLPDFNLAIPSLPGFKGRGCFHQLAGKGGRSATRASSQPARIVQGGDHSYPCQMVYNTHGREIAAPVDEVGVLIDSPASENDRLWPRSEWPAMRLDGLLSIGVAGGHGPVRYFVTAYEPGRRIEFQFTGPLGFNGHHSFTAISLANHLTLLRHELSMSPSGMAKFTWPLFFRPMHNALIEESLDRAENECSTPPGAAHRRSLWTKILRAPFRAHTVNK